MKLKKLLKIDIFHPVQSWKLLRDGEGEDEPLFPRRKWRFRFFRRGRKRPKPAMYTRTLGAKWPGPKYFSKKVWREDLVTVTEQVSAIIRANGPLAPGLEAAGLEAIRLRSQQNVQQFFKIWYGAGYASTLAGLVLAALAVVLEPLDPNGFVVALLGLILFVYFILQAYRAQLRRESVLLVMSKRIGQGLTLSETMRSLPRFFPRFYADLIETGESSGQIAACFDELNEETLKTLESQDVVRNNLLYLGCVVFIQGMILSFLAIKVVPVFTDIYDEFSAEIPPITKGLLAISDWTVRNYGFLMLAFLITAVIVLPLGKLMFRHKHGHVGFLSGPVGTILFLVPWFRGLIIKQNLAMAALILEKLLHGGATLGDALDSTANAAIHPLYRRKFARIRSRVLQGESLSEACGAHTGLPALPRAFHGFITLGENAGMMPDAIARIGRIYQQDADKQIRILSEAFLPFAVIALGYVTLLAMLGIYLPIFNLTDILLSQM